VGRSVPEAGFTPRNARRTLSMSDVIARLIREETGEDLVEYGLLTAFAAAVVTGALMNGPVAFRPALIQAFTKVKAALTPTP